MRSNFAAGMTADEDLQKGRITFAFMADDSLDYQSRAELGGIKFALLGQSAAALPDSRAQSNTALASDGMSLVLRQVWGESLPYTNR